MNYEFTFSRENDNDDFLQIYLNGEFVAEVCHDDIGWAGMEEVVRVCTNIKSILNKENQ